MAEAVIGAGAPEAAGLRPPSFKQVAAISAGNALEFYDFLTYAFFAVQIGKSFFPSDNPHSSLLATLATFGAGFLTRPVGALVLGRMADRVGRKPAMLASFALMGLGIVGLALTPAYSVIGWAAPILAILFRLLQGFALGGELGASTAILMEGAPAHRRGFYISFQYTSQNAAVLAAGLVGLVLAAALSAEALSAWGWRAAMLLGAAIVPLGLMLRQGLAESLHAPEPEGEARAGAGLKPYLRIATLGLAMLASGTMINYGLNYMATYAQATLAMRADLGFAALVVNGLCGVVFTPLGGWLCDRYGRRSVMIAPQVLLLAAVYPCYWAIAHYRTAEALLGATFVLSTVLAIGSVPSLVAVTESLPKRVRSGGLALIYAVAISVFGGSTQFMVAWLTGLTGDPLTPAWYMAGGTLVGLAAMLGMRETAPGRRRQA